MSKENKSMFYAQIAIVLILGSVLLFNLGGKSTGLSMVSASSVIPSGTPDYYGEDLGVSYEMISASNPQLANQVIAKLGNLDRTIDLQGEDLDRYISIVSKISCEYCCGAKSIIFSNGEAACGCAHSYAMRGVAKYLITEYGNEVSDDFILSELGKWKVLFFPGIHEQKANVMTSQGIDTDYISLTSNEYRGIEKGQTSSGGMVGGC